MCRNNVQIHRCGHRTYNPQYCENAILNVVTGRRNMCSNRESTLSTQRDSVCGKSNCRLSQIESWACHCCYHGPNRYSICSNCPHELCEYCPSYTKYQNAISGNYRNIDSSPSDSFSGTIVATTQQEGSRSYWTYQHNIFTNTNIAAGTYQPFQDCLQSSGHRTQCDESTHNLVYCWTCGHYCAHTDPRCQC
jgi:hypothetical protein